MSVLDQIDSQATEEAQIESTSVDIDLSSVPEKHRDYVDVEKYAVNEEYKRAIDHGYKPEKLYQEEGRDPDDFIGIKSWLRNYDKRQDEKALKSELSELRKGQEALISSMQQREKEAVDRALAAQKEELRIAIEDGDAAKAVELSKRIDSANTPQARKEDQVLAPVFLDFIEDYEVLNEKSPSFDRAFAERFWSQTFREAAELRDSRGTPLSHPEIEYYLSRNMKRMTKNTPSHKPPTVSKPVSQQKITDLKKGLSSEAQSTYNRIMQAKGGGKEAADAFAKEVLGGVK